MTQKPKYTSKELLEQRKKDPPSPGSSLQGSVRWKYPKNKDDRRKLREHQDEWAKTHGSTGRVIVPKTE